METILPTVRLLGGVFIALWFFRCVRTRLHLRQQRREAAAEAKLHAVTSTSIPELAKRVSTPDALPLSDDQAARLRPLLLHWLGLRTDLAPAQIAAQVPTVIRQRWFTFDLQHLAGDSDPHAALAFACLRVAFHLRVAHLLGWLDDTLYGQLIRLNAERTRECFPDWPAFVHASAEGRRYWQQRGRIDIFGDHISAEHMRLWLWQR